MRAKSISAEKLAAHAAAAARDVLGDRRKMLGGDLTIGVFPDIGTVGLIARDVDLSQFTATELLSVSADMAGAMSAIHPDATPVAQIFKGGVIAGYYPAGPIIFETRF